MTSYRQGDVVLVPFPFTDLSTVKHRPALILSSDTFNRGSQDVILAAITSQIPHRLTSNDHLLEISDLRPAGLPKVSIVKIGKIVTLDKRLIRKKIGSLPNTAVENILIQFKKTF